MDKEQEIRTLQDQLESINNKIKGEISRIVAIKTSLSKAYRRADKEKYKTELNRMIMNLKKYREETDVVMRKIAELKDTQ